MRAEKKKKARIMFGTILMTGAFAGLLLSDFGSGDLPQKYRLWLEEDFFYINTPLEKEIFLKLTPGCLG